MTGSAMWNERRDAAGDVFNVGFSKKEAASSRGSRTARKAGRVARGISSTQRRALTTAGDVLYSRRATTAPADRPVDEGTVALRACLEASLL